MCNHQTNSVREVRYLCSNIKLTLRETSVMQGWLLFLLLVFASGFLAGCNSRAYLPNISIAPSPTPPPGFFSLDTILPDKFLSMASFNADGSMLGTLGSASEVSIISQLIVIDLSTNSVVYSGDEELWTSAALSPDGSQVAACGDLSSGEGIYLVDLESQSTSYLTDGCWPTWSPDNRKLAFVHFTIKEVSPERHAQIRVRDIITGEENIIFDTASSNGFIVDLVWSPTGERLVFSMISEITEDSISRIPNLYSVNVDGTDFHLVTNKMHHAVSPSFSPDGKNILFVDWSAPLHTEKYLQVLNHQGQCHQLAAPISGIRRVILAPLGNEIAFETQYSLLTAKPEAALGKDFWNVGEPCSNP